MKGPCLQRQTHPGAGANNGGMFGVKLCGSLDEHALTLLGQSQPHMGALFESPYGMLHGTVIPDQSPPVPAVALGKFENARAALNTPPWFSTSDGAGCWSGRGL